MPNVRNVKADEEKGKKILTLWLFFSIMNMKIKRCSSLMNALR